MTELTQASIVDIVSEGRYQAMFALRTFFGDDKLSTLDGFAPVILAMQGLPEPLVATVGIAIIARFFDEEHLDPKAYGDRIQATPYAELLAHSINNAAQAVYRQMQEQEAHRIAQTKKLRNGLLTQ